MFDFGILTLPVFGALALIGYGIVVGPEVVIEPIHVPHVVEEQGLNETTVGLRLTDDIRRYGRAAKSVIREVNPAVENANNSYAALTNYFSVTALADSLRQTVGLVPYYFTGDFVTVGNEVELRLRAYTRNHPVREITHRAPVENAMDAVDHAAFDMLFLIDPYLAALNALRVDREAGGKSFNRTFDAIGKAAVVMNEDEQHFVHILWARALSEAGRTEEALRVADEAIRIKPDFGYSYNIRAKLLEKLGRNEEALAAHARAIHLDPALEVMQVDYADLLDRSGKTDKAIEVLRNAVEFLPNDPEAYNLLGKILYRLGRHKEGIDMLRQAVAHTNKDVDFFGDYSSALLTDKVAP